MYDLDDIDNDDQQDELPDFMKPEDPSLYEDDEPEGEQAAGYRDDEEEDGDNHGNR
jgi:hypothetical protein